MVVLEQLDEAQTRRARERSEWARKTEERRLDKIKAYTASEEIQTLGQKQTALIDRMIQDLFALTPEWEIRRLKARAVSSNTLPLNIVASSRTFTPSSVQSQSCERKSTLDQPVDRFARKQTQDLTTLVRVTQHILILLYFSRLPHISIPSPARRDTMDALLFDNSLLSFIPSSLFLLVPPHSPCAWVLVW